jgi:carbonic anhydrase
MSIIDDVLKANHVSAQSFNLGHLSNPPALKLAVLACMDARLTVEQMLGLKTGDAHIMRNAGAVVTEDVLRSLLVSHYMLGTREFMIINHTDCGMLTFKDEDLRRRLQGITGTSVLSPAYFYTFTSLEENVREQIQKVKSHPWVPTDMPVRGFIYDVKTGKLSEVNTR